MKRVGTDPWHRQIVGQRPPDLFDRVWLVDDASLLAAEVARRRVPLSGAYVPACLHEPGGAEATYDSAEWAAELLATQGRCRFVLVPFVPPLDPGGWSSEDDELVVMLEPSAWNHVVALSRRLKDMVERRGLVFHLSETVDGRPTNRDGFDPTEEIHYVLDTAGLGPRGWIAGRLASDRPTIGRGGNP